MDLALLNHASWILHWRLEGCDGWPEGNWIDAIQVEGEATWSGIRALGDECSIAGLARWSDREARRQWVEPFLGTVRLRPGRRGLASYEFHFADATKELGLVRSAHDSVHDWGPAPPRAWRFSFAWRRP